MMTDDTATTSPDVGFLYSNVWVVSAFLKPAELDELRDRYIRDADFVLATDGEHHVYGVDTPNCFTAKDTRTVPIGIEVDWDLFVGHGTAFAMLPISDAAQAFVDFSKLSKEAAVGGCAGLLWTPRGQLSCAMAQLSTRLLAAARGEAAK